MTVSLGILNGAVANFMSALIKGFWFPVLDAASFLGFLTMRKNMTGIIATCEVLQWYIKLMKADPNPDSGMFYLDLPDSLVFWLIKLFILNNTYY